MINTSLKIMVESVKNMKEILEENRKDLTDETINKIEESIYKGYEEISNLMTDCNYISEENSDTQDKQKQNI